MLDGWSGDPFWVQLILIKLGSGAISMTLLCFLIWKGAFKEWLAPFLVFNYTMMLLSVGWILARGTSEQIMYYYPMIIPFMMMWFASFYVGRLASLSGLFIATIFAYWLYAGFLGMATDLKQGQMFFFVPCAVAACCYNYFVRQLRQKMVMNDLKLTAQKEALTQNLLRLQDYSNLLTRKKDTLVSQLNQLQKQIPEGLKLDMEKLFESANLMGDTRLDQQVFSQGQLQYLLDHQLTSDQILLLSGLSLNLGYEQIQEKFFPHLSVRSLENMASKIRKQLKLPRGSNLTRLFERY